jgi:hypothetical protein
MSDSVDNAVPMFDVMPVTGTFRDTGRFCAVCALGGAPAMVVFIQKEQLQGDLLEKVQEVSDKYPALQVFVVVLGLPTEGLKAEMRKAAADKKLRIPLTLLPEGEIPALLPIDRNAGNNVFFYRGQRPFKNHADYDFDKFKLESARRPVADLEYKSATLGNGSLMRAGASVRLDSRAGADVGDISALEDTASAMLDEMGML